MSKTRWLRFWFRNAYDLYRRQYNTSRPFAAWRGIRAALAGAKQGLWHGPDRTA